MPTGQRYERLAAGKIFRVFETSTGETVDIRAPVNLYTDFAILDSNGYSDGQVIAGPVPLSALVGAGTGAAFVPLDSPAADACGVIQITGPSENNIQAHHGINGENTETLQVGVTSATKDAQLEVRLKTVKVSAAAMNFSNFFIGIVQGDMPAGGTGIGGMTAYAGFFIGDTGGTALAAGNVDSLAISCASKDGVTTVAPVATGQNAVNDTYAIYRIDFSDKANLKFYINGSRVLSATTFNFAGIAASPFQPLLVLSRYTGVLTKQHRLSVDALRWWASR